MYRGLLFKSSKSDIAKFSNAAILCLLLLGFVYAEEVCKFGYMGKPETFHNGTMTVPDEMVALSDFQYVPGADDMANDTLYQPSIMFVIDYSGSMMGADGNDPEQARTRVPSSLLDTLYKKAPLSEVGISLWAGKLKFDRDDDPYKVTCPGEEGGYCPLFQLNKTYPPDNWTGYEILKWYLQDNGSYISYFQGGYSLNGTNITTGVNASKHAFTNTQRVKAAHFNIFFSDGAPGLPAPDPYVFVEGSNVATTFTVFFGASSAPQCLMDFTDNVKANNYSQTNPKSDIWSIENVGQDTLMNFIMKNVINNILIEGYNIPFEMSVNGGTPSTNWIDSTGFQFPELFPLLDWTTPFEFEVKYHTRRIFVDQQTGLIDTVDKDTTHNIDFDVTIDPAQGPLPDSLWDVKCWDRLLGFYYNGTQITMIDETMSPIELRFSYDPGEAQYNYTNVSIEVTNTSAIGRDTETISLTQSGNTYTGTFPRVVIDDAASPSPGDGTLQHYESDNIVAVFRNNESPKLPLDTIRIQVPFDFGGIVQIVSGFYFDNNAEGYVDSIYVEATTDIAGGLTDAHITELIDKALTLPAFRGFTVNSSGVTTGGFYMKVTEDNGHNPVTYVTNDDKIEVISVALNAGGQVLAATVDIIDKVAPIIHWEPRSALLADYQVASKSDTLGVKFSEPVENVTAAEPFYFLDFDNNSNYSVTLLTASQPKPDSMVFHVVSVSGVAAMEDGDSLWIHETDLITDAEGNFQNNTGNIKRKLYVDKIYGSVDIASAYYFDNTADGYVDSIYVEATTDIDGGITATHVSELAANAISFPVFRGFTATGSGLASGGFYIIVTEDKGHNPFTYVTRDDKLQIKDYTFSTGGNVNAKAVAIYDRIAPIIHWDKKSAYLLDFMVDTISDTLTVKFSEPVNRVISDEPFYFLDRDNNTNYTVKLNDVSQPESNKMAFYVTSLSGVDFMEEGDSLWIQETDRVGDTEGNFQNNNKNTRRKLYVDRRVIPYDFNPVAISPIDLTNIHIHRIPPEVITILDNQGILDNLNLQQNDNGSYVGMLIMALPDPENIGDFIPDLEVKGHISIFDPVGNQVVLRNRMAWWHEKKRLLYVWNVKNKNSRTVGNGAYLAVIEIEDVTPSLAHQGGMKKKVKKILIGVGTRITR